MPISVVVGGQFGSEGKGKVALAIAQEENAAAVVRVGGTNSGHTAVVDGRRWALRQLPAAVLAPSAVAVLPPGAIIDPEIFLREVDALGLGPDKVIVDPLATIISEDDRSAERSSGIIGEIGSTGSGTGAALVRRMMRHKETMLAGSIEALSPFLRDSTMFMRTVLDQGRWIVIEGSQGFGLSLLHGGYYPKATSRDTTAGTFIGEAGLSPLDVKDVTLVLRTFPIRVAGDSGKLPNETTWDVIAKGAGLPEGYCELTTATKKVRRVARFDAAIVKRAIAINRPTRIVLNHFDYIDPDIREHRFNANALSFLKKLEDDIDRSVDLVGTGPATLISRDVIRAHKV
ncbi:adenylosuccinate synthetase [Bradyrhizobium yuanmingense]|uniref:adenylosuccinate synthetase n=1 Tax=Bradyrhizobium yuanmingense TaxID=108015 RepID=UPI0023B956EE|nr:adenylosuccinate synthetase [Bradyrhizobium yuanmingense]MDF0496075.1 adenylosuccinate synthetase [Bradyrhizobium yuanmingense]